MLVAAGVIFAVLNGLLWKGCPWPVKLALAAIYGVLQVLPLMHWLHDASHGSIGYSQTWWSVLGCFAMDWFAGASRVRRRVRRRGGGE